MENVLLAKIFKKSIDFRGKKFLPFQTILIDFYIDFSTNLRKKLKKQTHIEKKQDPKYA